MATLLWSATQTFIGDVSYNVVKNGVSFVESIEIFGYTLRDLPFVSKVLHAFGLCDDMKREILNLQEENKCVCALKQWTRMRLTNVDTQETTLCSG